MPGLLLPSATSICGIPYKNGKVFPIGITFVQLVLLPYSSVRSSRYFSRLHDFSVNIPRCYKDVYVRFPSEKFGAENSNALLSNGLVGEESEKFEICWGGGQGRGLWDKFRAWV